VSSALDDILDARFAADEAVFKLLAEAGFGNWRGTPLEDARSSAWHLTSSSVCLWDPEEDQAAILEAEEYVKSETYNSRRPLRLLGLVFVVTNDACGRGKYVTVLSEDLECKSEKLLAILRGDE